VTRYGSTLTSSEGWAIGRPLFWSVFFPFLFPFSPLHVSRASDRSFFLVLRARAFLDRARDRAFRPLTRD